LLDDPEDEPEEVPEEDPEAPEEEPEDDPPSVVWQSTQAISVDPSGVACGHVVATHTPAWS
jgi:hypothetical protein